ncbi:hypothetical protein [Streptomyces sp. XH2]|uniref:hypothetical protein n=1 Tax=Streptomyces sp. XH2 TaxID=3412483 RepID=UPI003C7A6A8C
MTSRTLKISSSRVRVVCVKGTSTGALCNHRVLSLAKTRLPRSHKGPRPRRLTVLSPCTIGALVQRGLPRLRPLTSTCSSSVVLEGRRGLRSPISGSRASAPTPRARRTADHSRSIYGSTGLGLGRRLSSHHGRQYKQRFALQT